MLWPGLHTCSAFGPLKDLWAPIACRKRARRDLRQLSYQTAVCLRDIPISVMEILLAFEGSVQSGHGQKPGPAGTGCVDDQAGSVANALNPVALGQGSRPPVGRTGISDRATKSGDIYTEQSSRAGCPGEERKGDARQGGSCTSGGCHLREAFEYGDEVLGHKGLLKKAGDSWTGSVVEL
jgi:hypothetical protein